ncbi:HPr family phosphocarrier protein [Thermosulfuriphilus ammonigenes]|uniref:HPr family phosphocarrier protein n=1 Tax=Thermosulfuriphilus ammonigenes TaxID=1936021 RepID=A0A6G7PUU9_9BACT|nr:HPr family phosphocarrier protein [Thermosulfuriphilus ammonigenes]MBA2848388.1 phosphocarrier protein [Thermosulfuriphilus ammonigenes]QIJ71455.1 HPr family phosphocarrier protein [Thermosulfuriphilus ammonigenes]
MEFRASFVINNKLGLHARPAAKLAKLACAYKAQVFLVRAGQMADAKSVLDILTLACPPGTNLEVVAKGPDAEEAIEAILKLVKEKFGEE